MTSYWIEQDEQGRFWCISQSGPYAGPYDTPDAAREAHPECEAYEP